MKIKRFTTDNPRKRVRVHYSITDLSEKDFTTICRALEHSDDPDAKSMLQTFGNLANVPDIDDGAFADMESMLNALQK